MIHHSRLRPGLLAGLALAALGLTGCEPGRDAIAPTAPAFAVEGGVDPMFNPQPDPPKEIYRFLIDTPELIDNPNLIDDPNLRPWRGTVYGADGRPAGEVVVTLLLPAVQRGRTVHLTQQWEIAGDGSVLPAVQVDGVLNLASGRLVQTGVNGDGLRLHVQGWLSRGGGSIGGELMFNPQPDPPRERR